MSRVGRNEMLSAVGLGWMALSIIWLARAMQDGDSIVVPLGSVAMGTALAALGIYLRRLERDGRTLARNNVLIAMTVVGLLAGLVLLVPAIEDAFLDGECHWQEPLTCGLGKWIVSGVGIVSAATSLRELAGERRVPANTDGP